MLYVIDHTHYMMLYVICHVQCIMCRIPCTVRHMMTQHVMAWLGLAWYAM